jgi:hypothetical protein
MTGGQLLRQTFSLMLIVLLLVGCGGVPVEPTATPAPTPVPPTATPILPTATPMPPTATPIPPTATPTPTTGTVLGVLINQATGEPLAEVSIQPLCPGELVQEWVVTDEQGAFTLSNVPPAECLIALSVEEHPVHKVPIMFFLADTEGNNAIFKIEAGQIIDLGEVPVTIEE